MDFYLLPLAILFFEVFLYGWLIFKKVLFLQSNAVIGNLVFLLIDLLKMVAQLDFLFTEVIEQRDLRISYSFAQPSP